MVALPHSPTLCFATAFHSISIHTDRPQQIAHNTSNDPPVSSLCKQVAVGKQLVFTVCSFIVSEWPDTKNVVSRSSMFRALCSPWHRFAREGKAELLMRHYAMAGILAGLFPKKRCHRPSLGARWYPEAEGVPSPSGPAGVTQMSTAPLGSPILSLITCFLWGRECFPL